MNESEFRVQQARPAGGSSFETSNVDLSPCVSNV